MVDRSGDSIEEARAGWKKHVFRIGPSLAGLIKKRDCTMAGDKDEDDAKRDEDDAKRDAERRERQQRWEWRHRAEVDHAQHRLCWWDAEVRRLTTAFLDVPSEEKLLVAPQMHYARQKRERAKYTADQIASIAIYTRQRHPHSTLWLEPDALMQQARQVYKRARQPQAPPQAPPQAQRTPQASQPYSAPFTVHRGGVWRVGTPGMWQHLSW